MTVYAYSRVSTPRQSDEGESLNAQAQRLAGYALMNGWEIAESFVERGVSGSVKFAERPEGSKLLAQLQRGDVIVCCKLDRCFRSALDALDQLERFREQGVELHLLDMGGNVCGNGIAKLVFTILSAVAEAERDRIRERISDVKRHQRSQGRYLGGTVPFGFRKTDDGDLEEIPQEQAAIKTMRDMRGQGSSYRKIAETMTNAGYPISFRAVASVLEREPGRTTSEPASASDHTACT